MVSSVEKMEKNVATIKIEVSSEDFKKAVAKAYQKNRGKFNIDGFRKGKAPQKIIENRYGKNVFYEDAIDLAFPEAYLEALEEHKIDAVSRPSMESIDAIGEDEGLKMTVSVAVMPEVELGEYKGQEIEPLSYDPAEEDVNDELAKMQDQNSRMVTTEDGEAKDGDTVTIDFEGFIDGVAFDGGKAEGHSLTLGSQTFIPGFEEQLVGTKKGDEVEVKVAFPEDYHADDFAGKEAIFNVKVNEIKVKEMPELDDEFAKDVSEFDTLDELKEDLKNKFKARKEKEAADSAKAKVVDGAVESAKFEIPDQMIEEEMEKSLKDFEYQLKMQGIDMEDYFKYTNMDKNKLVEEVREDSKKKISRDIVLTKITETESIEATDEEIDKEIEDQAAMYNMDVEKFKSTITDDQKEYFANSVKRKKTIDFLLDSAVQK
ncbi:trigger factor [Alkalibacter saccharofermentans]|uniref:Trigger factor n=1 Tax=Alkalibacter saccharofermentans DSM 14828 TaxID=1120975 RepID=A0A1M4V3C1_9FIRM|nr:trigger factor [Alkalibacter saccharofermentans]SHE63387.1 trigger factor [Alkalibacter saccharofermentans DSM 14828]